MAAGAGPGAAEAAVAWLQEQLRADRQHAQGRHEALLQGLGQLLGRRAAPPLAQAACRSENPMRATGELLEVAKKVQDLQSVDVKGSAIPRDVKVHEVWEDMDTDRPGDAEALSTEDTVAHPVRNTVHLVDGILQDRGLHHDMDFQRRKTRLPSYRKFRASGRSAVVTWGCLTWAVLQHYARAIVGNRMFDYFMGVIIVANCVTIGLHIETTASGDPAPGALQVLEHVFLTTYVLELAVRIISDWKHCWSVAWFRLDCVLVSIGVLSIWLLEPVAGSTESGFVGVVDKVLVIRILRLVRLVRALRFLSFMQPLWKLVSGLLGSTRTVMSAALIIFGGIYVFACAGVALFARDLDLLDDGVAGPIILEHFQSVPVLMLALVQFTTCDSVAAIYNPLIRVKPVLVFYFLPILLVIPISLMNLITAVIVDHAIRVSAHDGELERCRLRSRLKELVPVLNRVFMDFDVSGDGAIDLHELDLTRTTQALPAEVLEVLKSHKLRDFFSLLDADSSGKIDQSEWVDGMCCLILNEVPIESLQVLNMLNRLGNDLEAIRNTLLSPGGDGAMPGRRTSGRRASITV